MQSLIEAVWTRGFYVTSFGISREDVEKQSSLGQAFYELPIEEKLKYVPNLEATRNHTLYLRFRVVIDHSYLGTDYPIHFV